MKQGIYPFWLTGIITLAGLSTVSPAQGQIIPDATLPNNSQVLTQGNLRTINGGTIAGTNLFHSFRDFSVTAGTEAHFNNALTIQNIITRITGNSSSNIDGLLRTNGTANLFLLNPNGIIFGPNASLQIGGSFLASTAESLVFEDGTQFSTRNSQTTPLLTVSVPVGLQFGNNPGKITNRSQASPEGFTNSIDLPSGLTVIPGQTLALVGGDISLENGNLTAFDGRVELGSVANSGYVSLILIQNGWALGYENVQEFGNIQLSQKSVVDASVSDNEIGSRSGEINIRANQLILNNSGITTSNFSSDSGGSLTVNASFVELSGTLPNGTDEIIPAGLFSQAEGEGSAGDLTIHTRQLIIRDGANVSTGVFGAGSGGNLTVTALESIELSGSAGPDLDSNLSTQTEGTGNAGKLTIITRQLRVKERAQITSSTFDAGNAGDLSIQAFDSVQVSGSNSRIVAQVIPEATGSGENLTIETRELKVENNALISARTFGFGNAGNIDINAERLIVKSGGQIITGTASTGQGGTLSVNASESVELTGTGNDRPSGLLTQSQGRLTQSNAGDANNLTLTTRRLILRDGAAISADTFADGNGGSIKINASESVEIIGRSVQQFDLPSVDSDGRLPSRIAAFSRGSGDAGSLEINTNQLIIRDGATATVSSRLSTGANAGNLTINASKIRLNNRGIITAETNAGDQGNITINTQDLQMRRDSNITTNAIGPATGGNIFLNADTFVALENSDVSANSQQSVGGQVIINTQGIFRQGFLATEVNRSASNLTSDITATSNLGPQFDGTVNINTPDIDPTQGLIELPQNFALDNLPENPCALAGKGSQFVNAGRGGLPPSPREALNLGIIGVNNNQETSALIEAQGWIKDANDQVHLVVQAPEVTPAQGWEMSTAGCGLMPASSISQ